MIFRYVLFLFLIGVVIAATAAAVYAILAGHVTRQGTKQKPKKKR